MPVKGAAALLLRRAEMARTIGVSTRSLDRLSAAGLVPRPLKLGSSTVWRADEVSRWVAAGCPGRAEWEKIKVR